MAVRDLVDDVGKSSSRHISYFPAYEIAIDERRWVEPLSRDLDMVYVSDGTANEVVRRFLETYATDELRCELEAVRQLQQVLERARRYPALAELYKRQLDAELSALFASCRPGGSHVDNLAKEIRRFTIGE